MKKRLVDRVQFRVIAGDGGNGSTQFRRDPVTKSLIFRRLLIQPFRKSGLGEGFPAVYMEAK